MIKHIVRSTLVAVAMTALLAGGAQAQNTQQTVTLSVPASSSVDVSASSITLTLPQIAAGADTSVIADTSATYGVTTNDAGSVTASISGDAVPSGTSLYVWFLSDNAKATTEQLLNGSGTTAVTVLDGLSGESDTGSIAYRYVGTPSAAATTTSPVITVTYTFAAATP